MVQKIISCDWGTSALRLRVVDIDSMAVLAEAVSEQGISGTFNLWKQSGKPESERLSFYQSVLTGQVRKLEEQLNCSLQDMPLVISGMASSNIGMMELPYAETPLCTDGHELNVKITEAASDFRHRTLIISGVKINNDAMRGEETQLIGCMDNDKDDQLFIFPGTHSKHVIIKNGKAAAVTTFMTGEFFELLSKKSILSTGVEESRNITGGSNVESFELGVTDSLRFNLLHSSFLVRTNDLFDKLSKQQNYFYLSGLLIGTELKELITIKTPLTVVSDEWLAKCYSAALQKLGISKVRYSDAGKALITGHCKMYRTRM
ncbi:MAG TPA: 2-dehydro-3-deoxygalactonokinase [Chitinophagaceae bacterium]